MNITSLSERAMLASLNIRRWQAVLTDKKITAEVATHHAVNVNRAGKYRKNAIDTKAPSFEAVVSTASELRNKHYFYTLPWSQDGARILPASIFEKYSEDMRTLRGAFGRAVEGFVEIFEPQSCCEAGTQWHVQRGRLPHKHRRQVRRRYCLHALPDAQDFRASLNQNAVVQIKEGIQAELQKTMQTAMRDPYERLYSHISRMVERLSDKKAIFRDTLVTGLADLCAILPGLNLTGDERLDDLRKRAERMVTHLDPQDLREVPRPTECRKRSGADSKHDGELHGRE